MIARHKIHFLLYKKCKRIGLDEPVATILEIQDKYLMIKIPAHSYWSGRGMQSYASPEIVVMRLDDDGWWYECVSHVLKRGENVKRNKKEEKP